MLYQVTETERKRNDSVATNKLREQLANVNNSGIQDFYNFCGYPEQIDEDSELS